MAETNRAEEAILQTVLYSSIFEYPLTESDLESSLAGYSLQNGSVKQLYESSDLLIKLISFENGYFCPRGHSNWIDRRHRREERSLQQICAHAFVLKMICSLPFIRMVALSGSAAHLNMDEGADIDLVVITKGKTVWSVAVATLLLTKLLRCRKRICFNYVLSDRYLPLERHDLFAANQMIHLRPLIGQGILREFLAANPFVSKCYPNFDPKDEWQDSLCDITPGSFLTGIRCLTEKYLGPTIWPLVEVWCRTTYKRYLLGRSHLWKSPEEVKLEPYVLKLHTNSHRSRVLDKFHRLLDEVQTNHLHSVDQD